MSATSGIGVSKDLSDVWASAVDAKHVRFIKVAIANEQLVHDTSLTTTGTLEEDLNDLQTLLTDNDPAYVLARLDEGGWLAISYVPDTAKVRDKMLYASTRNSLTKALGSTHFKDNLFATSKEDLTREAYEAHKRHQSAPKPMSEREKEAEATRLAEKEASLGSGSRTPVSHIGQGLPSQWTPEVEEVVKGLNESEGGSLIILSINPSTEKLQVASSTQTTFEGLGSSIPSTDPSFAFFKLPSSETTVFIYSCPSGSPVKNRMIYSASALGTHRTGRELLPTLAKRKIETSDPSELDEAFIKAELGDSVGQTSSPTPPPTTGFARPKGPARKR